MSDAQSKLTELIEDIENFGHKFMFLMNAASADAPLSERARIGFLEYGVESVKQFNAIEEKLKSYRENCIPN
ncbi:hypothetical protein [Pseudomonas chlororaphis]|uniref:hypothetical protein n=1 Tax=Pseudomonas chlororaphis TaxID=587753 RepID=UPI0005F93F21|nr:hypothetical protein [Pseudomonas chlororaphis]